MTTIPQSPAIRVSDSDREKALALLRRHWLAGRLTLEEFEERCDDAGRGLFFGDLHHAVRELPYPLPEDRPPAPVPVGPTSQPAQLSSAILSLVLGSLSLCAVLVSFGMLFIVTLPAATCAWRIGRGIRRSPQPDAASGARAVATVGETLGAIATVISCLALSACAVILA